MRTRVMLLDGTWTRWVGRKGINPHEAAIQAAKNYWGQWVIRRVEVEVDEEVLEYRVTREVKTTYEARITHREGRAPRG